jgi:hypothetical protein
MPGTRRRLLNALGLGVLVAASLVWAVVLLDSRVLAGFLLVVVSIVMIWLTLVKKDGPLSGDNWLRYLRRKGDGGDLSDR